EGKWDGIRAQLVRRGGSASLWSRGEELITDRFPDLRAASESLPDGTVLDGEVLAYAGGAPLPFSVLQRRIGRQKLTAGILADAPAAFISYDVLEMDGRDLRASPLVERRALLSQLVAGRSDRLVLSEEVAGESWEALASLRSEARQRGVEGLMLKRRDSPYRSGRPRGDWWKWKIDPYTIDAVLVYAQPGNGRRANVLTDMTFAVWNQGELLPVAKAYSGLTDEELDQLDRWSRQHTVARSCRDGDANRRRQLAASRIARRCRARNRRPDRGSSALRGRGRGERRRAPRCPRAHVEATRRIRSVRCPGRLRPPHRELEPPSIGSSPLPPPVGAHVRPAAQ